MILLPFALRRCFPTSAMFDSRWRWETRKVLPWFGLLVAVLVAWGKGMPYLIVLAGIELGPALRVTQGNMLPATVLLNAFIVVLAGPVAEEIFWRGYLQDQLRKAMPRLAALFLQSLLFALLHLQGLSVSIVIFGYGVILGVWRLRFRGLLPLIVAHIVLNAVVSFPVIRAQYMLAAYGEQVRSNPQVMTIDSLAEMAAEESIPKILEYLKSDEEDVQAYAIHTLASKFGDEGTDHFRSALRSDEKQIVRGVLNVISQCRCDSLTEDVRQLACTSNDTKLQVSALVTLKDLGDVPGLRKIEQEHSSEKVREIAGRLLELIDE